MPRMITTSYTGSEYDAVTRPPIKDSVLNRADDGQDVRAWDTESGPRDHRERQAMRDRRRGRERGDWRPPRNLR